MDAALLAQLHAAGLRALVYTVNEPAEARSGCVAWASTASSPTRSTASRPHAPASGVSALARGPGGGRGDTGLGAQREAAVVGRAAARAARGSPPGASRPAPATAPSTGKDQRRAQAECSPSQPPSSAPGPAGSRISQRIVLVMRPSSGSGVTAWRSARKLMKISTAPTPNSSSISAKAATPQALGRRHGQQQPAAAADREAQHQARARADAPADAVAEHAGQRRCPRPWPCSTGPPPARYRPSVRVANRICTTIAAWWHICQHAHQHGQRHQQAVCRRTKRRPARRSRQKCAPACGTRRS